MALIKPFLWLVGGVVGFDESCRNNSDRASWFSTSCSMVNDQGRRLLKVGSRELREWVVIGTGDSIYSLSIR
jgi:hypothetical protein